MNTTNLDTLEDRLEQPEPSYSSEEEAQIGDMLDQYGIPFFYQQATIVYDQGENKLIYPAFTLPDYGPAIIDYMKESYGDKYKYKSELYEQNQMPAVLITPEYLKSPVWQQQLYQQLNSISTQSAQYQTMYK